MALSLWLMPALLVLIPLYGWMRRVAIYDAFIEGAEEGILTTVRLLPYIAAIFVALSVFRAGGALELLSRHAAPLLSSLGFPPEVLPLMLVRPLSGSGALAITADLMKQHGPDSFVGRLASVMQGSTDTTFYIITVYFGAAAVRRTRYAALVGLSADCAGYAAALIACRFFFGRT